MNLKTAIYYQPDGNRIVGPALWLEMPTDYMTEEEWLKANPPVVPTFDELYAAKYAEIISGANAVKQALFSKYSAFEEQTWA